MHPFNYHRPSTLAEAAALHRDAEDPAYLSGGHTLLPTMAQRLATPSDLIDLEGIAELAGIAVEDGALRIGAFTRHAEVAASAAVRSALPALAELAEMIGDAQVRNRGTIGGSLANSDPAADYPAAVLALNAVIHTDQRQIAADDYFRGLFETALEDEDDDEIITRIDFAIPNRAAYEKFPNPASRYAIVGVMVADFDGAVRVGVTGAGPCAFRAHPFEEALSGGLDPAALDDAAPPVPAIDFNSDMHASAEYRAHLVRVMAQRATARLVNQSNWP